LPNKTAAIPILQCLAEIWDESDRNMLVYKLARDGAVPGDLRSVFYFLAALKIENPHEAIMLLNFGKTTQANEYFMSKTKEVRQNVIQFLVSRIEMSTDARLYSYESLPFFNDEKMAFYPKKRSTLINTVQSLCRRTGTCPPDSFLNVMRPQYIQELKEKYLDGTVSIGRASE
jgi:hypothetical protein